MSWHKPHLNLSLELITERVKEKDSNLIDIGGGASTLVDDLLRRGYKNISVLDISSEALRISKDRLKNSAESVRWIEDDITSIELPQNYFDLWHDRAVFHFLTEENLRQKYKERLNHSLKIGGVVMIAAFSPKGPEQCSGLDVIRYGPEALQKEFGKNYRILKSFEETHQTPFGTAQEFVYCCFKREY